MDMDFRNFAIHEIGELSKDLDEKIPYLASCFLDRYLDIKTPMPEERPLFVTSCLTMAYKLSVVDHNIETFLAERNVVFPENEIIQMELSIWRTMGELNLITPFSALNYYTELVEIQPESIGLVRDLIARSQTNMEFMEMIPSVIAASAVHTVCRFMYPVQVGFLDSEVVSAPEFDGQENMFFICNRMMTALYDGPVALPEDLRNKDFTPGEKKFADSDLVEEASRRTLWTPRWLRAIAENLVKYSSLELQNLFRCRSQFMRGANKNF